MTYAVIELAKFLRNCFCVLCWRRIRLWDSTDRFVLWPQPPNFSTLRSHLPIPDSEQCWFIFFYCIRLELHLYCLWLLSFGFLFIWLLSKLTVVPVSSLTSTTLHLHNSTQNFPFKYILPFLRSLREGPGSKPKHNTGLRTIPKPEILSWGQSRAFTKAAKQRLNRTRRTGKLVIWTPRSREKIHDGLRLHLSHLSLLLRWLMRLVWCSLFTKFISIFLSSLSK